MSLCFQPAGPRNLWPRQKRGQCLFCLQVGDHTSQGCSYKSSVPKNAPHSDAYVILCKTCGCEFNGSCCGLEEGRAVIKGCLHCGKYGHWVTDCPLKDPLDKSAQGPSSMDHVSPGSEPTKSDLTDDFLGQCLFCLQVGDHTSEGCSYKSSVPKNAPHSDAYEILCKKCHRRFTGSCCCLDEGYGVLKECWDCGQAGHWPRDCPLGDSLDSSAEGPFSMDLVPGPTSDTVDGSKTVKSKGSDKRQRVV